MMMNLKQIKKMNMNNLNKMILTIRLKQILWMNNKKDSYR